MISHQAAPRQGTLGSHDPVWLRSARGGFDWLLSWTPALARVSAWRWLLMDRIPREYECITVRANFRWWRSSFSPSPYLQAQSAFICDACNFRYTTANATRFPDYLKGITDSKVLVIRCLPGCIRDAWKLIFLLDWLIKNIFFLVWKRNILRIVEDCWKSYIEILRISTPKLLEAEFQ